MPRANSLLLRLTLLALALNVGCAFPFFRSKDRSLEEVVGVEKLAAEDAAKKDLDQPAAAAAPRVAQGKKPMPPIARFFSGLFGRGKSEPPADPISTIPDADPSDVAEAIQPKIEINNTGDIGAGVVAPKQEGPTQVVMPQVSNLAEMTPSNIAAPKLADVLANPTQSTSSPEPPPSQSGSLTAALRSALDNAAKEGLAHDAPQASRFSTTIDSTAPQAAATSSPSPSAGQSQIVELDSAPLGSRQPEPTPVVTTAKTPPVAAQVIENPTINSSPVVTAARKLDGNPLRGDSPVSGSAMTELAASPIGAKPPKAQTVFPAQESAAVNNTAAEPAEATTLVAFQTHVHAGDSIVNQLKESRRVNQFRPMFDAAVPSPAAQATTAAVKATEEAQPSEPTTPTPTRAAIVAVAPNRYQPTPPVATEVAPATPTAVAATPTPVEIATPALPATPQLPTEWTSSTSSTTAPANRAASPPRSEAFAQLAPSEMPSESLEQPGSETAPQEQLVTTPTNPVRAVPRVATPPVGATPTANVPQVATRPTPPTVPPVGALPRGQLIPRRDPVATPKLAPVVTVEEYRRMQQQRRSQATRRY
ncbi:hypothetical protein [Blastopirellula retiformator]|uniref:Uncharacterized protein n=1 Tax=Blastopirellula retiformator TaxID=2527970 RepID=A0A5C5UYT1_9BACT|nr:hypothetical protein [Blastopirellula retiformator]TWT31401.1 hypothetical protein Enr8_33220 [Blastopirellula retiformator]